MLNLKYSHGQNDYYLSRQLILTMWIFKVWHSHLYHGRTTNSIQIATIFKLDSVLKVLACILSRPKFKLYISILGMGIYILHGFHTQSIALHFKYC